MAEKKVIDLRVNSNLDKVTKDAAGLKNQVEKTSFSFGGLTDSVGKLSPAFGGAIQGAQGLNTQFLTILANPFGAAIAGIVAVVTLLYKAFNTTEENSNKLGKGMTVLSGLFSGLLKVLEPVASFLVDGLVKGFEMAGNAILKTSSILQKALKFVGLDAAAAGLKNLTGAVTENIKQSQRLADAEAKLVEAQRLSQKVQLDFQKQAEKIRQQRDDETNSVATRIKLNAQLGALLQKQLNEELKIANQALTVANLRIQIEGKSKANLDERAEALTTISDIQERISGQESEQLANLNSLRREQNALIKEQREEAAAYAKERQDEILKFNDLNQKLEDERKERNLENEKDLFDKRLNQIKSHVQSVQQTYAEDAEAQKQIDNSLAEVKQKNMQAGMALGQAALAVFGQQSKAGKVIAAGLAAIDTFAAINGTLRAVARTPLGAIPGYAIAQAVATGVFGLLNVKKILSTQLPGGGGGGSVPSLSTGGSGGGRPQDTAPQFNVVGSNGISQVAQSLSQNRQPIKAFVVGKDVSTQQALDRNIVKFASLG